MHPEKKEVKICKQTSVHKSFLSDKKKVPGHGTFESTIHSNAPGHQLK